MSISNVINFKVPFFPKRTSVGDKCYICYKCNYCIYDINYCLNIVIFAIVLKKGFLLLFLVMNCFAFEIVSNGK